MADAKTLTPANPSANSHDAASMAAALCAGDDLAECIRALHLALETAAAWKKCRCEPLKVAFWRDVALLLQRHIESLDLDVLVARAK